MKNYHLMPLRFVLLVGVSLIFLGPTLLGVFGADQWYVVPLYLNVRNEGKYGTPIIDTLGRGDKVTLLESLDNGWRKIELNDGRIGYVNGRYLSGSDPIAHIAQGSVYAVSVGNAFVRDDTLQKKIAVVRRGDMLQAMDDRPYQGKWIRVQIMDTSTGRYNNQIGYIFKDLIEVSGSSSASIPAAGLPKVSNEEGDWIEDVKVSSSGSIIQNTTLSGMTSPDSEDEQSLFEDLLGPVDSNY